MFVPEVCTDGIETAPQISHLAAVTLSFPALPWRLVSPSTACLTLSSFSRITSSTCSRQRNLPQFFALPLHPRQLFSWTSKEQVVGTLEGGKVCARASSYSWRKIYPGNACDQCPLAIVSTPALWSLPPLLSVPLLWSALGHDPGENPICYLCSPKRLLAKRKKKRGKSYRSHWFLQLLLEAKERVVVGSFY